MGQFLGAATPLVFEGEQVRCYVRPSTENTREKGCDIGYALATGSCEEADSVETCTVTAP